MTAPETTSGSDAQAVIDKFLNDIEDLRKMPGKIENAINKGLHLIPFEWIKEKIQQLWSKLKDLFNRLIDLLKQAIEGAFAPFTLIMLNHDWKTVKGDVSSVASTIDPNHLQATQAHNWQGAGATDYRNAVTDQAAIAGKFADVADSVGSTLFKLGLAGIGFYVAAGIAIAMLIAEYSAEVPAAATGVGTGPAVAGMGISTGKAITIIGAAATALSAFVAAIVTSLNDLDGDLNEGKIKNGWFDPGSHAY